MSRIVSSPACPGGNPGTPRGIWPQNLSGGWTRLSLRRGLAGKLERWQAGRTARASSLLVLGKEWFGIRVLEILSLDFQSLWPILFRMSPRKIRPEAILPGCEDFA